jgi:ATP-dependent DNA helicase RecG
MNEKLTKSPRLNHLLYEMGIRNAYDVINYLPRRYEDLSYTIERNLTDKQRVVLLGRPLNLPQLVKHRGVSIVRFDFQTKKGTYFKIIAFNRPYLSNIVTLDNDYTLVGTFDKKNNEINLVNIIKGVVPLEQRFRPVYSLPSDYPNHLFAGLVNRSLKELEGKIYSSVPFSYQRKYRLIDKEKALWAIHMPKAMEEIAQGFRHLKYEEALNFSLKNQCIREENKSLAKIKKEPIDLSLCEPFLSSLPYQLSQDQKKASQEIIEDMNQSSLMYRLLQGDVGTGKTLVAFVALYANYLRGDQGVIMAPTDALARQHFANAQSIFASTKIKIGLLLGSTGAAERKMIKDDLEDGTMDILIGTHALFSKSVVYSSLGLVVIDEQHRFGVNQRITLANKGEHADLLMMSATPIPRSLALSIYGDLDISTLISFPKQVRQVKTEIVTSNEKRIYQQIDQTLAQSRRIYIVAPLIDFKEDGRYSVDKLFAHYILKYPTKVALLHGKMKYEEKEESLENFKNGSKPILVSTPVIEVGIDVSEASLMIIYDASSFGLASLHQLRGRIGRDGYPSNCFLVFDQTDDEERVKRLNTLARTNDGFEIAEEDLKMRGPGELAGYKQSGLPSFIFLNVISDFKIFTIARDDARDILKNREQKEFQWLIKKVEKEIIDDPLIKG